MAAPVQMTAHTLDALKGWPSPYAVDYTAKLDANITTDVPAGTCVSVNALGKYQLGVPSSSASVAPMPMFTFQNSYDYDVSNDGGASTDEGAWFGTSPAGNITALVAAGAYELETTEFYTADMTNTIFTPGTTLTAATGTAIGAATNVGKVAVGEAYIDPIVGVVSRVPTGGKNSHGKKVVCFWPVYLPDVHGTPS